VEALAVGALVKARIGGRIDGTIRARISTRAEAEWVVKNGITHTHTTFWHVIRVVDFIAPVVVVVEGFAARQLAKLATEVTAQ